MTCGDERVELSSLVDLLRYQEDRTIEEYSAGISHEDLLSTLIRIFSCITDLHFTLVPFIDKIYNKLYKLIAIDESSLFLGKNYISVINIDTNKIFTSLKLLFLTIFTSHTRILKQIHACARV